MLYPIRDKKRHLGLCLLLFAKELLCTTGSSVTVGQEVLRRVEGVPGLGRGYSATTNTFLSSCLEVNESEIDHSYDFEFQFTSILNDNHVERQLQGVVSQSFGFERFKEVVAESANFNRQQATQSKSNDGSSSTIISTPTKRRYTIAVTMRVERNFSTIVENKAPLSPAASRMIEMEEYVSFFMTCGPNFVRSLHRAQEVTAIFTFTGEDQRMAERFAETVRLYVYGNRGESMKSISSHNRADIIGFDLDRSFTNTDIMKSLSIELIGYGLGLNKGGLESLATTSLDEFNVVMRYAFDSMIKTNHTDTQSGMVYEMEVFPWANNLEFLRLMEILKNDVVVQSPHGLIENVQIGQDDDGNEVRRCSSDFLVQDDYGKCCDELEIKTTTTGKRRVCQENDFMLSGEARTNLIINAEFVSWLGSVAHEKVASLSAVSQCVSTLRTFPKRFDYFYLESNDQAEFDDSLEMMFTLKELKAILDPTGNLDIVSMVGDENEEFFEMFYQPCLSALYGMNYGDDAFTDPKYFMAEPWYNHEECTWQSCMGKNMAWDRINGNGCIDGLLGRKSNQIPIPAEDDPYCAKLLVSGQEECKYKYPPGDNLVTNIDNCLEILPKIKDGRGNPISLSISDIVDHFCMPQLAMDEGEADPDKMDEVDDAWTVCAQI